MPKYMIEVDEEIERCWNCPCCADQQGWEVCRLNDDEILGYKELEDNKPDWCPLRKVDDFGRLEHIKALYESTKERYKEQFRLQQNEADMEMWYIRNDILNDLRGQIKAYEVVLGW